MKKALINMELYGLLRWLNLEQYSYERLQALLAETEQQLADLRATEYPDNGMTRFFDDKRIEIVAQLAFLEDQKEAGAA